MFILPFVALYVMNRYSLGINKDLLLWAGVLAALESVLWLVFVGMYIQMLRASKRGR